MSSIVRHFLEYLFYLTSLVLDRPYNTGGYSANRSQHTHLSHPYSSMTKRTNQRRLAPELLPTIPEHGSGGLRSLTGSESGLSHPPTPDLSDHEDVDSPAAVISDVGKNVAEDTVPDFTRASTVDPSISTRPDTPVQSKNQPLLSHFRPRADKRHDLTEFRDAVLDDLGQSVPEVSIEIFQQKFLPTLSAAHSVETIANALMSGTTPILTKKGWTAFIKPAKDSSSVTPSNVTPSEASASASTISASSVSASPSAATAPSLPLTSSAPIVLIDSSAPAASASQVPSDIPRQSPSKKSSTHEDNVYFPLEEVVNAIIDNTQSDRQKLCFFEQRPNANLSTSFSRSYNGKPDGYAVLIPPGGDQNTLTRYGRDVVFAAEYKKSKNDVYDVCPSLFHFLAQTSMPNCCSQNVKKICGSMAQIMRDDPTRRFTFGITLEKFDVRFWYCDRSQVVVSESFNMMTVKFLDQSSALPEAHFDLFTCRATPISSILSSQSHTQTRLGA